MSGLTTFLLDGAPARRSVSVTAAGAFGVAMALAVLCVEEFRMARVSPDAGALPAQMPSAGAVLPLGLVRASAESTSTGCQLFLASHYINDQKKFKATMDTITPDMMPKGVTSHAFLPSADGHTAFCVWESADGDYTTIRNILNDFEGVTSTLTPVDDPWGVFECSA